MSENREYTNEEFNAVNEAAGNEETGMSSEAMSSFGGETETNQSTPLFAKPEAKFAVLTSEDLERIFSEEAEEETDGPDQSDNPAPVSPDPSSFSGDLVNQIAGASGDTPSSAAIYANNNAKFA